MTRSTMPETGMNRRMFLGTVGTTALATTVGTGRVTATQTDEFNEWMADVPNFDGDIVDERGSDEVRVSVGAGDGFVYDPPAVRVDPGTTVVWEWTGDGGGHNVTEDDGVFESDLLSNAGDLFEHTFDETGTFLYVCTPHVTMGMKGAIIVGEDDSTSDGEAAPSGEESREPSTASRTTVMGTAVAFLLILLSPFGLWLRQAYNESHE